MNILSLLKKPSTVIFVVVLVVSVILASLAYYIVTLPVPSANSAPVEKTAQSSTPLPLTPTPTYPPVEGPAKILGVQSDPQTSFPGIGWVRIGYPSCGWGDLYGDILKSTIEQYHSQGIRVLLTVCQGPNNASLYNTQPLQDAAQGGADAVQCGNEEMKQDASVSFLYIPPQNFARFYALCEQAVHAVRPNVPVLLGSLDPHVGGIDYQPLVNQAQYLDQMQQAMNTTVHPGGNWDWHTQTLGLIDSWHNGYPNSSVNSLAGLFSFWAQQFHVSLASGQLGEHLWVVEGTGCFKGCGIDDTSPYQVAVSHVITLITDVQTAMQDKVPFFYFSGKDFISSGYYWPIGVLDVNGHPKPLRQDLSMGARTLTMTCSTGTSNVTNQEQLLSDMYNGCTLPANYLNVLYS